MTENACIYPSVKKPHKGLLSTSHGNVPIVPHNLNTFGIQKIGIATLGMLTLKGLNPKCVAHKKVKGL